MRAVRPWRQSAGPSHQPSCLPSLSARGCATQSERRVSCVARQDCGGLTRSWCGVLNGGAGSRASPANQRRTTRTACGYRVVAGQDRNASAVDAATTSNAAAQRAMDVPVARNSSPSQHRREGDRDRRSEKKKTHNPVISQSAWAEVRRQGLLSFAGSRSRWAGTCCDGGHHVRA